MSASDGATFGKRVLVELSHAIERFALAADPGSPLVVIAMFQRLSYFQRESEVYRQIAARSTVTLVALVEDFPPQLPPGVRHVLLPEDDELAREWSVTVLGPGGGATLVAVDQETVDEGAHTLEDGRRFVGNWSFRRADAYREVLRMRAQLRLPAETVTAIDEVLHAVLAASEPREQRWWNVPLAFLAERVDVAVRERAGLQARLDASTAHVASEHPGDAAERDPRTGLFTAAFLQRWTTGLGAGLPVGLVLLRVPGVADLRGRYGLRAELAALQGVTRAVAELLDPVDRLVRLGREDFLLVLPSWSEQRVLALCDEVCARVARLDQQFPFVALPAVAAATVTRDRPLPIERLVRQVNGSERRVSQVAG
ncbi:DICT sensory domain-containing protein [Pseudonocardia sp.]|uniref:sensor domain-containing diguanylate cyclase n=1 Tax=Pseudonocardia sp. TaxID=60912 RepID=UPI00262F9EB8|nr:DICT sensory domain-containing protein [Pseudonocardia sp.]